MNNHSLLPHTVVQQLLKGLHSAITAIGYGKNLHASRGLTFHNSLLDNITQLLRRGASLELVDSNENVHCGCT